MVTAGFGTNRSNPLIPASPTLLDQRFSVKIRQTNPNSATTLMNLSPLQTRGSTSLKEDAAEVLKYLRESCAPSDIVRAQLGIAMALSQTPLSRPKPIEAKLPYIASKPTG
jgi:hypothetical protein